MTQPVVPFWVMAVLVTVSAGMTFAIANAASVHASDGVLFVLGTAQVMVAALMGVLNIARRDTAP